MPVLFIILLLGSHPVPAKKIGAFGYENRLKIMPSSHLLAEKELVVRTSVFDGQSLLTEENSLADFEVFLLLFTRKFLMTYLFAMVEVETPF